MTKQWSNKSFCTLLRKNGYTFIRQKGNHQLEQRQYSNLYPIGKDKLHAGKKADKRKWNCGGIRNMNAEKRKRSKTSLSFKKLAHRSANSSKKRRASTFTAEALN